MKKFNIKDGKVLTLGLCLVAVCVFTLTIAYAALNAVLTIQGSAKVSSAEWDIYLSNPRVTNGSATTDIPQIKTSSTLEFSTTLNLPGDFYEFTVDVVNDGSIDAMIDGVTKTPSLTETQAKYLNYIVEYQNGESINTKQLVAKNSFVRLLVKLEFRKDISASDLPTTSETLNLSFTVNYVQADTTGTNVTDNGVKKAYEVISGDLQTVGSEVAIGEEHFYIISSDEDSVTMLAKYNLYVGGVYNSGWTAYGDEPTGKQDSTMLGWVSSGKPYKGTTAFSSSTQKGTNYSDYSGSIIEGYVNNYNSYLITQGVTPTEARLITKDELNSLGCNTSNYSCRTAPSWVYATSYWSETANGSNNIWGIYSDGEVYDNIPYKENDIGVRPVITISKSVI